MKKIISKSITVITMLAIVLTMSMPVQTKAASKKTAKLSKKSITLTITNKKKAPAFTLKVKNTSKKSVKWTMSNKKVATVKKTGKYSIKITAKKAGKATITCKTNNKKLTCKINVVNKIKNNSNNNDTQPNNTPIVKNCDHEWTMFEAKLVTIPMDDNCYHVVNGTKTEYMLCGHCFIPYKNINVSDFAGVFAVCPNNPQKEHTVGTFIFSNGTGTAKDETPKKYYIVADGQCAKCGAYHEPDEYK